MTKWERGVCGVWARGSRASRAGFGRPLWRGRPPLVDAALGIGGRGGGFGGVFGVNDTMSHDDKPDWEIDK